MDFGVLKNSNQLTNMQDDFKDLETHMLIDMLAKHTEAYTKLMTDGSKDEFENCRQTISLLQNEINARKQDSKDPNS